MRFLHTWSKTVQLVAPSTMPAGYQFLAVFEGTSFTVEVVSKNQCILKDILNYLLLNILFYSAWRRHWKGRTFHSSTSSQQDIPINNDQWSVERRALRLFKTRPLSRICFKCHVLPTDTAGASNDKNEIELACSTFTTIGMGENISDTYIYSRCNYCIQFIVWPPTTSCNPRWLHNHYWNLAIKYCYLVQYCKLCILCFLSGTDMEIARNGEIKV